jgi:GT2 family glycosyltransferase
MRKFSVIIVASRGGEGSSRKEQLEVCLRSLASQTYPRDFFEILVIDSGSAVASDFFSEFKSVYNLNLKFISNPSNIGPAKGRNIGIRESKFDFVAFTDDDSTVPPDWLSKIDDAYERHPEAGAVGGLTLPCDISRKNIFAAFEERLYLSYLKNGRMEEYVSVARDEHPVFSGNISYKKETLLKVGSFDESFPSFISGEDGDLKERVLAAGGTFVFTPVVVSHHCAYTLRRFFFQQLSRGASILKFKKQHGMENYRILILGRIVVSLLALPYIFLVNVFDFRYALVLWMSLVIRNIGKLYYYEKA